MSDPFDDVLAEVQSVIDVTPVAGQPEDTGPFDGVPVMTAPVLVERADPRPVYLSKFAAESGRSRASVLAGVITGAVLIALGVAGIVFGLVLDAQL